MKNRKLFGLLAVATLAHATGCARIVRGDRQQFQFCDGPAQGDFDGPVRQMILANGSVFASGSFEHYRSQATPGLVKLDPTTGELDEAFVTGLVGSAKARGATDVNFGAIAVQGSAVYGVMIDRVDFIPSLNLVKLNQVTGELDPGFLPGVAVAFSNAGSISTLVASDSALYVGGTFHDFLTLRADSLLKLSLTTGERDLAFEQSPGPALIEGNIQTMALEGDSLFIGGMISAYKGTEVQNFAKINETTGALDPSSTSGFRGSTADPYAWVSSILSDRGFLYVGGDFGLYRGSPVPRVVKLDPATGNLSSGFSFTPAGQYWDDPVAAYGGQIYMGAEGGPSGRAFYRVSASTGALDSAFQPVLPPRVSVAVALVLPGSIWLQAYRDEVDEESTSCGRTPIFMRLPAP